MLYNFCTLFDQNYASRGLALYRSLERVCTQDFRLTILCMDAKTHDILTGLALPRARLWLVDELGDAELLIVRQTRPLREFCWTCPGPLMLAMLRETEPGEIVTYLDADLCFFSDPAPVYAELGEKDIFIHGHNFAPRHMQMAKLSGIFNVGLLAVRNSPEGLTCIQRWRTQCLKVCELDVKKGYCGDQKYLDEWPVLYRNLVIAKHPGICLAPWNIEAHDVTEREGQLMVDEMPLIFYHYHGLKMFFMAREQRWVSQPASGYDFTEMQLGLIYGPYIALLIEAQAQLENAGLQAFQQTMPLRLFVSNWFGRANLISA